MQFSGGNVGDLWALVVGSTEAVFYGRPLHSSARLTPNYPVDNNGLFTGSRQVTGAVPWNQADEIFPLFLLITHARVLSVHMLFGTVALQTIG